MPDFDQAMALRNGSVRCLCRQARGEAGVKVILAATPTPQLVHSLLKVLALGPHGKRQGDIIPEQVVHVVEVH